MAWDVKLKHQRTRLYINCMVWILLVVGNMILNKVKIMTFTFILVRHKPHFVQLVPLGEVCRVLWDEESLAWYSSYDI